MATATQYLSYLNNPNVKAFLDTIAWAEGGTYNKLFGGGTFTGDQHPNRAIKAGSYTSTAAGRYQFLYRTWIEIKNRLGLADFSPRNQDIAALDLINQKGQLNKLVSGDIIGVLRGLGCAWAALPYSNCKQKERSIDATLSYYKSRLGNAISIPVLDTAQIKNVINNTVITQPQENNNNTMYAIAAIVVLLLLT